MLIVRRLQRVELLKMHPMHLSCFNVVNMEANAYTINIESEEFSEDFESAIDSLDSIKIPKNSKHEIEQESLLIKKTTFLLISVGIIILFVEFFVLADLLLQMYNSRQKHFLPKNPRICSFL